MSKSQLPTLDEKLDEALKHTFPASDPFALFPNNHPQPGGVRRARTRRAEVPHAVEREHGS